VLAFHRHHTETAAHPWQQAHAAPADRAVGLELQLIELHHQRDTHDEAKIRAVDAEIALVLAELVDLDQEFAAAG
jgi:hypothetical protein